MVKKSNIEYSPFYLKNDRNNRLNFTHKSTEKLSLIDLIEQFLIDVHEFDINIHVYLVNQGIQFTDDQFIENLFLINFRNNLFLCRSAYHNIELRLNSSVEIIIRTIYENILRDLYMLFIWENQENFQEKVEIYKEYMTTHTLDRQKRKELWDRWNSHFGFNIVVDQLYVNKDQTGDSGFDKWYYSKVIYSLLSEKSHGHIRGSII